MPGLHMLMVRKRHEFRLDSSEVRFAMQRSTGQIKKLFQSNFTCRTDDRKESGARETVDRQRESISACSEAWRFRRKEDRSYDRVLEEQTRFRSDETAFADVEVYDCGDPKQLLTRTRGLRNQAADFFFGDPARFSARNTAGLRQSVAFSNRVFGAFEQYLAA